MAHEWLIYYLISILCPLSGSWINHKCSYQSFSVAWSEVSLHQNLFSSLLKCRYPGTPPMERNIWRWAEICIFNNNHRSFLCPQNGRICVQHHLGPKRFPGINGKLIILWQNHLDMQAHGSVALGRPSWSEVTTFFCHHHVLLNIWCHSIYYVENTINAFFIRKLA